MSVFRDEKKIAELVEQIAGIETPVSEDLEERIISGLEAIKESGGSGGGGGAYSSLVVTVTVDENETLNIDKTPKEIFDAVEANKPVMVKMGMGDGALTMRGRVLSANHYTTGESHTEHYATTLSIEYVEETGYAINVAAFEDTKIASQTYSYHVTPDTP